jgi:hypothetical protein
MKWPWRSNPEPTVKVEEDPPVSQGPLPEIHSSPGLEEALRGIPADGSCRVLDLGSSVADNVEFASSFASRLQIVDLLGRVASSGDVIGGVSARIASIEGIGREYVRSFHLVLAWDVVNYLSDAQAKRLLQTVAELCLPGARLHMIVYARDTMPTVPIRYRIIDPARLSYEPTSADMRGAPHLPPAAVERLLTGFRIEHSFVLQHGVHEYVASRKRWYIKK